MRSATLMASEPHFVRPDERLIGRHVHRGILVAVVVFGRGRVHARGSPRPDSRRVSTGCYTSDGRPLKAACVVAPGQAARSARKAATRASG